MSAASATEAGQVQRALTSRQPWASLIAAGVKDVENRSWPVPSTLQQWRRCSACGVILDPDTPDGYHDPPTASCHYVYDGPFPFRLWIHAGAAWDSAGAQAAYEAELICDKPDPQTGLRPNGQPALWRGVLLGSVLVTGCHWSDECRETKSAYWPGRGERWESFCSEWAEPDAYHWTLADPQPLPEPIPMRGHQRLWTLPDDVAVPA